MFFIMKKKLYVIVRKEKVSKSVMELISTFRNRVESDYSIAFYDESPNEKKECSFAVFDSFSSDNFLPSISIVSNDPDKFGMLFSAVLSPLNELFSIRYIDSDQTSPVLPDADR